jgi:hypothetical protein
MLMNEYGNLDNDRYQAFEKAVGKDVEAFLKALLKDGAPIADVRLAVHYLMMYLTGVEAAVVLKEQIRQRREKTRLERCDAAHDRLMGKTPE